MTTTKEFLKEVKEQDLEERQVEVEAIGIGLNKFVDSEGVVHNFGDGNLLHLDVIYDCVRWYPSDMYEHLSTLKQYAGRCNTVCEFGTNDLTSTIGLLSGFPKHLITLDLNHPDIFALTFEPVSPNRKEDEKSMVIKLNLETVNKIAADNEIDFKFIQTNSLEFSFNSVDLLFIDSLHTYTQLTKELMLHAKKVKKYIGIDPSTKTYKANINMCNSLGFENKVELVNLPAEDVDIEKYKNSVNFSFTSPPYFSKEHYAEEKTQSFLRYPTYDEWVKNFLEKMITLQYKALKKNCYNLINIADVKIKNKTYNLVNSTIQVAEKVGFTHEKTENYELNHRFGNEEKDIATEPLLIFKK